MDKVKRLAIILGRLTLPTCFSIECQDEIEANTLFLEGKLEGKLKEMLMQFCKMHLSIVTPN